MADIATVWSPETGTGDWTFDPTSVATWTDDAGNSICDEAGDAIGIEVAGSGGLISGQDLQTAALISLFTDAEAGPDDTIPDGTNDSRGWWAGPIGSRLWLRARSKATPELPALIRADIVDALAWMIEDEVVAAIDVTVDYAGGNRIDALVAFRRRDGARAAHRGSGG